MYQDTQSQSLNIISSQDLFFCQVKPQLQLSWAELALLPKKQEAISNQQWKEEVAVTSQK